MGVTIYALLSAKGRIAAYLWMQLAYTPFIWATYWIFGNESQVYLFCYIIATTLMLILAIRIVSQCTFHSFEVIIPAITAAYFGVLAFLSVRKPNLGNIVCICEGVVLFWCGATIGRYAKHAPFMVLSILWLLLAAFRLGFALHNPVGAWIESNRWVPAWITISGILGLGFTMQRHPPRRNELA